jgi:hypothetical protein
MKRQDQNIKRGSEDETIKKSDIADCSESGTPME